MEEYEGIMFEAVKDVTKGKRALPSGTQPRKKKGVSAQDIIDSIV